MSSIEQNGDGGEMDGGQEVTSGLIVAGRDSTELLEFGEAVLSSPSPSAFTTSSLTLQPTSGGGPARKSRASIKLGASLTDAPVSPVAGARPQRTLPNR